MNCLVVSSPWSFCWLSVFILLIQGSLFRKEVSPVSGPSLVCAISLLSASIMGPAACVRGTARPNHAHWSPYQLHGSPAPCAHLLHLPPPKDQPFLSQYPLEHVWLDFHLQLNPISLLFALSILYSSSFFSVILFIFIFLAVPSNMWDLSPSTRDQTHAPFIGSMES